MVYLFSKYLLGTFYVSQTVVKAENVLVNEKKTSWCLHSDDYFNLKLDIKYFLNKELFKLFSLYKFHLISDC